MFHSVDVNVFDVITSFRMLDILATHNLTLNLIPYDRHADMFAIPPKYSRLLRHYVGPITLTLTLALVLTLTLTLVH